MDLLISIVVPIYNVEKYLEKCLKSIIGQTYKNFELILVDDGSTDCSGKIADEYATRDNRICVFHKENAGLAATRNFGINKSNGEYICFIDSDDWIENTYLEELMGLANNYLADVVICDFVRNAGNDEIIQPSRENIVEETGYEAIGNLYTSNYVSYVVAWNKLYRKSIFDNVRYIEGMIHEDEAICGEIYCACAKVIRTNRILYNYRVNNSTSIMASEYSLKRLDILKALEHRMSLFEKKGFKEYYERDSFKYMYKILLNIIDIRKMSEKNDALIKDLKVLYWKKYKESLNFDWSIKRKAAMLVCGIFPRLYMLRYKK